MAFNALTAIRYWNATTNDLGLVTGKGVNGDAYRVSVAGSVDLGQAGSWAVNDIAYFLLDRWVRIPCSISKVPVDATDLANAIAAIDLSAYATKAGTLAQFAATTSAELLALITGETGTGALVFAAGPTMTLPNATGLPDGGLSLTDVVTNDVSTTKHGFAPKLPNDAAKFLNGVGAWAVASQPAGAQKQFVSNNWTGTTTTNSSTYAAISAAATAITPATATNKVRVQMALSVGCNSVTGALFRIKRNGTVIGADPYITAYTGGAGTSTIVPVVVDFLDSPASASSVSYTLEWRNTDNVNGLALNTNPAGTLTGSSTVSLTEIVA